MRIAEASVGKMETQLKQWGTKLDKVIAKVEAAGSEVKVDYRKGVKDLNAKYKVVRSKLDKSKAAGSAKWGILKSGLEAAWNDLEAAFKQMGGSPVRPTMANRASPKARMRRVKSSRPD